MFRLIVKIAANALGIYVAARFIPGFEFGGSYLALTLAALVFTAINSFVRPIVRFFSTPFVIITFGLFLIIINMAMLWLLDLFITSVVILNLTSLFLATVLISLINLIIHPLEKKRRK